MLVHHSQLYREGSYFLPLVKRPWKNHDHLDTAISLEKVSINNLQGFAADLARHFEIGLNYQKASYYYEKLSISSKEYNILLAIEYAEKGLECFEKISENQRQSLRMQKAGLLLQKGIVLIRSERADEATEVLSDALCIAVELGDSSLEVDIRYHIGKNLLRKNMWQEGIDEILSSIEKSIEVKKWSNVVESIETLRERYKKRGDLIQFHALCDKCINIISSQQLSDESLWAIAEILEDQAWIHNEGRNYAGTLSLIENSLGYLIQIKQQLKYSNTFFKTYNLQARVLGFQGEYEDALKTANIAIEWASKARSRKNQAIAHMTTANIYRRMGDLSKGKQESEEALLLAIRSNDLITIAQIESDYGLFLSLSGEKKQALEHYEKSKKYRFLSGSIGAEQISDNNISAIYKHLGNFSIALETYQYLYNKAVRENDKGRQSLALNHMGDIFRILNRMDESERCHRQCIQLCDEFGQPARKALALYRLGLMYLSTWQLPKAYTSISEANIIYDQIGTDQEKNRLLVGYARYDLCRGEFDSAMNKLTKASETLGKINDKTWLGRVNLNFSLLYLYHGQPEDALSRAEVAYYTFSKDDYWRLCEAKIILSRCYISLGRFDRAKLEIEEAKPMFLQFGLFHRLNQIDNLEALLYETESSGKPIPSLLTDELQYNFGYLGL